LATETAVEVPAVEDKALTTARRYRDMTRKVFETEITRQRNGMNLNRNDVDHLRGLIGLPIKGGTVALKLTVTTKRVAEVPAGMTPAEMVERVANYSGYNLNNLDYVNVDHATLDNIEGLPEPPAETPVAEETVESITDEVDAMRATVRQWVINNQHRWCGESGINESLARVNLEPLPVQRYWELSRRTVDNKGRAWLTVSAYSEEEAREKADWANADIEWDESPVLADEVTVTSND
jgi:hypothetical protein